MTFRPLLALLPFLTAAALAQAPPPGAYPHAVSHDDIDREVLVQIPDGLEVPAPLLLVLHGLGDSGAAFAAERTGLLRAAERRGWLVAVPSGTPCRGRAGGCWASRPDDDPALADADDVGFLRAVVDDLDERVGVDRARVMVVGFSNGASMAHRLAAEAPDLIAAAAALSGTVGKTQDEARIDYSMAPTPTAPVPMLIVKGLGDEVFPFHGSAQGLGYDVLLGQYDANYWATFNGCDLGEMEKDNFFLLSAREGAVATITYPVGCRAEVRFVALHDMSHAWPTRAEGYDADREVLAFFDRQIGR